jgi:hydrogenase maturation protein HypF
MLPYTGLHIMLFDRVREPAFVMTSANPPNEPIVTEDEDALKRLGRDVDYFLFHNRPIAQRCDDSVVRLHGRTPMIIRRSRGYAPEPIRLSRPSIRCVLGVGGEENVTACILLEDKAFLSQHIGDVENLETLNFLRATIDHLTKLTNCTVEAVARDLHPRFNTTRLAQELGEKFGCPVIPVQHHYAHLAGLMAEHNVDELVGIVCDGFGYGLDGTAWGGEVLYSNTEGFRRLGHLQPQPMVGGDLATRYPLRMAAGILSKAVDIEGWLRSRSRFLPHGEVEASLIAEELRKGRAPIWTTSCGRVLDAVSAILDICQERTYEGEPAMKLESAALKGRDALNLEPKIIGDNILDTTYLALEIMEGLGRPKIADLAYSAEAYLARGLAQIAVEKADELDVEEVGFSGGVAYNEHITQTMRKIIEENGLKFLVHRLVPPGDGGISFGQSVAAAYHP